MSTVAGLTNRSANFGRLMPGAGNISRAIELTTINYD
jgi:hypothetical protein